MGEKVDMHVGGYHLTEAIGTGGMGSVFRAAVEVDGKSLPRGSAVAVKLLHPHLRTVQEFVKRFHREARLAAAIGHPNVVRPRIRSHPAMPYSRAGLRVFGWKVWIN